MISATRYSAAAEIRRQSELGKEIAKLQSSVSSGKRLTAGSDDPAASARIADIRQTQGDQAIWSRNIDTGGAIASAVDDKMTSIATLLDRAKELLLTARNDTASDDDRKVIAAELRGLASDLQNYSTESDPTGRPLFPTGAPLAIPVSDTLSLPATASRSEVFGAGVDADGDPLTLSDILNQAADGVELADPVERAGAVATSIGDVDDGAGRLAALRADQGVRAQRFDDARDALQARGDALTEERQDLEGTDLTAVIAEFQAKQLSLQAAQTLFAKTAQTSLFDLLG